MSDAKHAVLEIERARVEALLRHDVAALDRMIAEECVHTESNGMLRTKAVSCPAGRAEIRVCLSRHSIAKLESTTIWR